MKIYDFMLKDSPLESPFAPKEKRWVAAAISAAAALGSAILGSASNNSTNNANEDINQRNIDLQREVNDKNIALQRETNAQNYQMFQEQNAFNLDMWNKQNEYNAPAKEVQRLLAAGINPSSKFGSSTPASSVSSSQGIGSVAPHAQAPQGYMSMRPTDFSGISDAGVAAVNAYNSSRLANAEYRNKEALTSNTAFDTASRALKMNDDLKILHNMASKSGFESEYAKSVLSMYQYSMQYDKMLKYGDVLQQRQAIKQMQESILNMQLNNDLLKIEKAFRPQMNRAAYDSTIKGIQEASARIGLICAQRDMTQTQQYNEVQKTISTMLDNEMKGVDLHIKNEVKDVLVRDYKNRSKMLQYDASMQGARDVFGMFKGLIPNFAVFGKY